ncbi:hypothetical protein [Thalassobaculum sp.]|uniref:hypothetical protein n=1 Tax=Thalassobaculum sp. TaxID=2022740 RepID=UPI003B5C3E7D
MSRLPAVLRKDHRPSSITPKLDSSEFRWLAYTKPDQHSVLPSREEEHELRGELEAANEAIEINALERALAKMVGAYPQRPQGDQRPYILALAENIAEYPEDVVRDACRQIVRTSKWLPTVAELVEICEELADRRRKALRHLNACSEVRRQHADRQAKAEVRREVQDAENRRRRAANAAVLAGLRELVPNFIPLDDRCLGLPVRWWAKLSIAAQASEDVIALRAAMDDQKLSPASDWHTEVAAAAHEDDAATVLRDALAEFAEWHKAHEGTIAPEPGRAKDEAAK